MSLRRGSVSVVEMLRCRTQPAPFHGSAQDLVSPDKSENSAPVSQNKSLSPPLSRPHHLSHPSAGHLSSPVRPSGLHHPSEVFSSGQRSPQPQRHCRACMSALLRGRTKGGGSLGHVRPPSLSPSARFTVSPTSPPSSRPSPSSSSATSPSPRGKAHLSPPPQPVIRRSLYEGGDLILLNHCLHHIVGRRTSSPTLSDYPPPNRTEFVDTGQSRDVPLLSGTNLDRRPLSPQDSSSSSGRKHPPVGQRWGL